MKIYSSDIESRWAVYPVTGVGWEGISLKSTKEYREALGVIYVLTVSTLMISWFQTDANGFMIIMVSDLLSGSSQTYRELFKVMHFKHVRLYAYYTSQKLFFKKSIIYGLQRKKKDPREWNSNGSVTSSFITV